MKIFLAALVALAAVPALAQTASAPDWPACEVRSGTDGTMTMRARPGAPCAVLTQGNNRFGHIIATAPQNGTALSEGARTTYQSRPGFSGRDTFVVRVTASGLPARFLTVNVEVR